LTPFERGGLLLVMVYPLVGVAGRLSFTCPAPPGITAMKARGRAFTVSAAVIPGRKIAAPVVIQARRKQMRQGLVRPRLAIGATGERAAGAPWHAPP
jgi:hypothetical protein